MSKKKETTDTKNNRPLTPSANLFPVVGIGASAGGLDAFKRFIKAIPADSGMAYVLVQHLHPDHESMLPSILQKVTPLSVLEITDDIKVKPDHIYIIPSNKMMIANDGVLSLSPRLTGKNERNLPIDLFFTSLAEIHQSHSIGVVLSGTASDGTKGLQAIKDQGGITFAQDIDSAAYDGMPDSAIQAGVVDFVLPPEAIPGKLLELIRIAKVNESEAAISNQNEDTFRQMLSLLRIRKGTDFTYYKQSTVHRRILRRMALSKSASAPDYLLLLRENKSEQDILYQDLLIPVTSFFRDTKVFETLCETIFPQLLKNKKPEIPIRIWVAGCSTGQEVYSIAICLREFLGDRHQKVQIFGTDISEPAIAKARSALYEKNELDGLSVPRLKEFFSKNNGGFQVNRPLRDMCVFAVHNFLKDPPFGKLNMISCRNVLIYMEPYLQQRALTTFHYSLNPDGFLLLGKSETIGSAPQLFGIAVKSDKLFNRKDAPAKYMHTASQYSEQHMHSDTEDVAIKKNRADFQKSAEDIITKKYSPPGVVVNDAMDIVHFHGKTSDYLEQLPGKPSIQLLKLAKEGLAFELRNILHKTKKEGKSVIKENIALKEKNSIRNITIEAIPLPDTIDPHYLILFHERTQVSGISNKAASKRVKTDAKDLEIESLRKELEQAREDMRSITEDQEAINEELQSANEELLSGSEELQSLNEELETGKEELQSTNEELTVTNQEMLSLNEQVTESRNFAETIIATLREPLLVLDKNLRIKTANKSFFRAFHVTENETEGKLIYQLGNEQWNIPELRSLLENLLPNSQSLVDYEVNFNFPHIGQRTMLLNASELINGKGTEKLILISFGDITERRIVERRILTNEERFRNLLLQSPFAVSLCKGETMIIDLANDAMKEVWGKGKRVEGKSVFDLLDSESLATYRKILLDVYHEGKPYIGIEQLAILMRHGKLTNTYFNFTYQPYYEADGTISGIVSIAYEVTEQVLAKQKLEENRQHLQHVFRNAPAAIALLEMPQQKYMVANAMYQQLFNQGAEQLVGKSIKDVFPEKEGKQFYQTIEKAYQSGEPYVDHEFPATFEDNGSARTAYFDFVAQPIKDNAGVVTNIMIHAFEITAQIVARKNVEESEAHFRQLANLIPDKVMTANESGRVNYYNQNWSGFTGLSVDKLAELDWTTLLHKDEQRTVNKQWNDCLSTGNDFEMELRVRNKNGEYKWHLARIIPVKDGDEKTIKWIGCMTDIQKIKEEEQRKGEFIKMVSHELKTPVTSIKGYVQMLLSMLKEADDKPMGGLPIKSSLERIDKQIIRLTRLITEILDLSRLEESKLQLKTELFVLNDLVQETVQDIQFTNTSHLITVQNNFTGIVDGDRERMQQVIINLINNAIKYSPDKYNISVSIDNSEENQIIVKIKDEGIGLAKDDQAKIFDRFYRVGSKSEDSYSGFGIGLFITKEIIERHKGTIKVDSEPGKGSVFSFSLPLINPGTK